MIELKVSLGHFVRAFAKCPSNWCRSKFALKI